MPLPHKESAEPKSSNPRDNFYPPYEKAARGMHDKQIVIDRQIRSIRDQQLREMRDRLKLFVLFVFTPFATAVIVYLWHDVAFRFVKNIF